MMNWQRMGGRAGVNTTGLDEEIGRGGTLEEGLENWVSHAKPSRHRTQQERKHQENKGK